MENGFSIDIFIQGEELNFEARLVPFGYSYKIIVNVNNIEVSFEPDESRNYRAIVQDQFQASLNDKDKIIIGLLLERLDSLNE